MNRLVGKTAFLAGATSGIGRAAAELFAAEGARVVVAGRRTAEGEEVVNGEIVKMPPNKWNHTRVVEALATRCR